MTYLMSYGLGDTIRRTATLLAFVFLGGCSHLEYRQRPCEAWCSITHEGDTRNAETYENAP